MSRQSISLGILCISLCASFGLAQVPATAPATQAGAEITQPTLITLHFQNADPALVLAELAKQAQTDIALWPNDMWTRRNMGQNPPLVSIDIDKQPFWAAMVEFCDKAKVQVQSMGSDRNISLTRGEGNFSAPHCFSGPLAIFASSSQRSRSIQFAGRGEDASQVQKNDQLTLEVYIDPRSRLISYGGVQISEAVDDKGTSLVDPKVNTAHSEMGMIQRGFSFITSVPLKYPNDGYTKLSRLKGNILVVMATKTQILEIPDFEKSSQKNTTVGGVSVSVQSVKLDAQQLNYKLVITRDFKQPHFGSLFSSAQDIHIVDGNGHSLSRGGGGSSGNDWKVEINATLNGSEPIKAPLKLIWEIPTESRQEAIPFELTDLPLPPP